MKRELCLIAALLCVAAAPVKIQRNSMALEFSYEWPAEAAAIPALQRRLRAQMEKDFRQARNDASEDQAASRQNHFDFHQNSFSLKWTSAGQSPRLLSLQSETDSYAGGAHPNSSYGALLWDRRAERPITVPALFASSAAFAALTRASFCSSLTAERLKRRSGEKLGGEFDSCPQYADLAIAPLDRNANGRFDAIGFVASPYVAGPYVEGEYEIIVPVTTKVIAALKAPYRSSFEAQRQ